MTPGTSTELDDSLSFVEGDTWSGIPSISILVNGIVPTDDVASARMQFRTQPYAPNYIIQLSSADATITITSAANWTFSIPEQDLALAAGNYVWSFETTDIAGVVQTYLQGNIKVLKDITR